MKEFRVPNQDLTYKRDDVFIRVGLWGMVATLAGIAVFSMHGTHAASPQMNITLASLAALIVVCIVIAAYSLAVRNGLNKAWQGALFILTDDSLVYERIGHPEVKIAFAAITSLYMHGKNLVVESSTPKRRVVIPGKVEGFDTLYGNLAKHKNITARSNSRSLSFAKPLIYGICCALVLWSSSFAVITISSVIGLGLIALDTLSLYTKIKRSSSPGYPIAALICFEWLGALLIAYFRFIR